MVIVSQDEDVVDALLRRRMPSARVTALRNRARASVSRLRRKQLSEHRARRTRMDAVVALRGLGHDGLAERLERGQ